MSQSGATGDKGEGTQVTNKRPSYLDSVPSCYRLLPCPLGKGRLSVSFGLHPSSLSEPWVLCEPSDRRGCSSRYRVASSQLACSPPLPEGRMPGDPESRPGPGNLGKVAQLGLGWACRAASRASARLSPDTPNSPLSSPRPAPK